MNCLEGLKQLPDNCIDCVITSPPYHALRNYGTESQIWDEDKNCKHDWKEEKTRRPNGAGGESPKKKIKGNDDFQQIVDYNNRVSYSDFCIKCGAWKGQLGLEPDFKLFVKHLCDIFDEVKRVLKPTGTCFVNLGDSYSGSNGVGYKQTKTTQNTFIANSKENVNLRKQINKVDLLPDKCLAMIPSRFAIEMCNRGWILRNKIIWEKPNAMPSSASDRFTRSYEEIFFFTKQSRDYFFEQQFDPYTEPMNRWGGEQLKADGKSLWDEGTNQTTYRDRNLRPNSQGRNKREVWSIPTVGNPYGHFAMYPKELVETPIKAGCPEKICSSCGKIVTKKYKKIGEVQRRWSTENAENSPYEKQGSMQNIYEEDGYDICSCNKDFVSGIVLDPFMGAGTTAVIAKEMNRQYIGFELNPEYCKIAEQRLNEIFRGLF